MAKKYESKLHRFIRLGVPILVGAVLIGGAAYLLLVRPLQIANEKKQFEKARLSIEELYTKLEAKIGTPDQIKRESYCSYTSAKFSKGRRACSVKINGAYLNVDLLRANTIMSDAASLFNSALSNYSVESRDQPSQFVSPDINHRGDQSYSQSIDSVEGFGCGVQYLYPVVQDQVDPYIQRFNNTLFIEIYCSKDSKAEHYPLKTF